MGQGVLLWLLTRLCASLQPVVPCPIWWWSFCGVATQHGNCLCEVCWLWWVHVASCCWVLSLLWAINLPVWWMAAVMCCCHGCEVWAFGLLDGPARGHILCGVHNRVMGPVCTLSVTVQGGGCLVFLQPFTVGMRTQGMSCLVSCWRSLSVLCYSVLC